MRTVRLSLKCLCYPAASLRAGRAEALENIREAITVYLESLEAHGEPVPPPITGELVEVEV
jgi:predicted RNase H-like HicB family nuclease